MINNRGNIINEDTVCESSNILKLILLYLTHFKPTYKILITIFFFFKGLVEDLDKDKLWVVMAAIMDSYDLETTTD